MPKPILKNPQSQMNSNTLLSATLQPTNKNKQLQQMNKMNLDRLLRKPRSKEYVNTLSKLDAGGHVRNQNKVTEIINAIKNELPEVEISGILLGIVSKCYLGEPYEVHSLDITGQIIEHYKAGEVMPGGLEKARTLAARGGYAFIEVYIDSCRCISSTGSVSVVEC